MSSKTKTPTDTVIERDGFAEITLTRPRQVNGMETAVLRMREPTVEDMERYQDDKGSDAQREVRMIANLCEISPEDVRKMPLRDYARLQAGVALLPPDPATDQAGSARPGRSYRLGPARNHDTAGVEVHLVDSGIAGTWPVTFKRQRSRSAVRCPSR